MKLKIIVALLSGVMLLTCTQVFAKGKPEKVKKEKSIPYGLQKKLARTGELPPGWEKKLKKGEILSPEIMQHATLIEKKKYPNEFIDQTSEIYRIQDKVIRVIKNTNEIINILK